MKKLAIIIFLALVSTAHAQKWDGLSYTSTGVTFAQLTALVPQIAGTTTWCRDCTTTNTCAGSGTGAMAIYNGSTWGCVGGVVNVTGLSNPLIAPLLTGGNPINGSATNGTDKISNISVNGVFNVKAYGAKGDGTTDDTAAIVSAYNAACAAATANTVPTVYFPTPSGAEYFVQSPLVLSCALQVQLLGDSETSTYVGARFNDYPVLVLVPPTYSTSLGTISAASLATGSGSAMNWNSGKPWYLRPEDVIDSPESPINSPYPLNGLSGFDVRLFANIGSLTNGVYMFTSGGDPGGNTAVQLYVQSNGAVCTFMTISGVLQHLCGAAGAVTAGTTHEYELAFDGSKIYLFLDGTQVTGSPLTAAGTITQTNYEGMFIGMLFQNYPDSANTSSLPFIGQMDSFQLSNVARHTANYTADTTKFSGCTNTLVLLNGSSINNPLITADCPRTTSTLIVRNPLGTQGAATFVKNLTIGPAGSVGIFQALEPAGKMENVRIRTPSNIGLELFNNSYEGRFDNLHIEMSGTSEAAISGSGAVGVEQFLYPQITAMGIHGIEGYDLGGEFLSPYIAPSSTAVDGFFFAMDGFAEATLTDPVIDSENGGTTIGVNWYNGGTLNVIGGDMQTGTGAPCFQIRTSGGVLGVNVYGLRCETSGSPSNIVNFLGSGVMKTPMAWYNPVVNFLSYSNQTTIPWTNTPADLAVYGDVNQLPAKTFATLPSSPINGTQTYCSDCTIANPCAGSGTGAVAKRLNGVWVCN